MLEKELEKRKIAISKPHWCKKDLQKLSEHLNLKNPFNDDFIKEFINNIKVVNGGYIIEDPYNNSYGYSWTIQRITDYKDYEIVTFDNLLCNVNDNKKILIQTFSSGIDSTTTIYKASEQKFDFIFPINYIYGQKNLIETKQQESLIKIIQKDLENIGDVTTINIESMFHSGMDLYKKIRDSKIIKEKTGTEYYTPMRNMLFSTIAAMIGELISLEKDEEYDVYIGIGVHKHSDIYEKDYWDITPEFIEALANVFKLNDNINLKLYAPYKYNTKTELIKDSLRLNVPYKETWTCYNPNVKEKVAVPCLECEACLEREKAFINNDVNDGNNYICQLEDDIDNKQTWYHYKDDGFKISFELMDEYLLEIDFKLNSKLFIGSLIHLELNEEVYFTTDPLFEKVFYLLQQELKDKHNFKLNKLVVNDYEKLLELDGEY